MSAREDALPDVNDKASSALSATITAFPGAPFAVVDGGLFDDLPSLFKRERLFARSLYLDHADEAVQRAGPWLAALGQSPEATAFLLGLPANKPSTVFWSCAAGEAVLYRHLRSLNMARIPEWAASETPQAAGSHEGETWRTVFFRHYDPRVLTALMPCLDAAQFSRVIGPADEIAYVTPTHGLQRVVADQEWPPAAPGLLTVRGVQFEAMVENLKDASRGRLCLYLRTYASKQTEHLDDAALFDQVAAYEQEAQNVGVRAESSIGLWCFMRATSVNDLSHEPFVARFMADPRRGSTPEERMDALFSLRTDILRARFG